MTLTPSLTGDASNPGPLKVVTRDAILIAVPWWLVILLVIAAIVLVVLRIRTKRDEKAALEWMAYMEAEAQRKAIEQGQ